MNVVIRMRRIISAGIITAFLLIMAGTSEWLLWANTDHYPHWLAREITVGGTASSADLIRQMPAFEQLCGRPGGFAVVTKVTELSCGARTAYPRLDGWQVFTGSRSGRPDTV